MITRKTPEQLDKMAASGEVLVRCLRMLAAKARPGVTTKELARIVAIYVIEDVGQTPFKGTDEAIVVSLVIPALAPVHVVLPE